MRSRIAASHVSQAILFAMNGSDLKRTELSARDAFNVEEAIDVDVVIIGGGIQGLWLLADLVEKGYSAVVLERMRPGYGQTGHSHVFLHQGHMYAAMQGVSDVLTRVTAVQKAHDLWKEALLPTGRLKGLAPLTSNFYVGWTDPGKAGAFEEYCSATGIPYKEIFHTPLEFGTLAKMRKLYESKATCLQARELLGCLLNLRDLRKRVCCCDEVLIKTYSSSTIELVAKRGKANLLGVRSKAVVLAAGAGNERLLHNLSSNPNIVQRSQSTKQQTIKTFMLVIRHFDDSLPLVTGMFPEFGGIFIVSRRDDLGRTVWLIGDKQRQLVPVPGEMTAFDANSWFRRLKTELTKLFPQLMNNAENYEWGVYEATKAETFGIDKRFPEGGVFPGGYHLYKEPDKPIWLTWPTLLTFAPLIADEITNDVVKTIPLRTSSMNWSSWERFCPIVAPEECRWKTTALLNWKDFVRCFS